MIKHATRWVLYIVAAFAAAALIGCASTPPPGDSPPSAAAAAPSAAAASPSAADSPSSAAAASPEAVSSPAAALAEERVPSVANSPKNLERLQALWAVRSKETSTDYPIGIGDVLQISVPGVDDFKERTVRVGSEGNIDLPLVGSIHAAGVPESELRDKLTTALEKYMYNPQVDLFVKEYKSRQVAVVGAVRAPGLVTLSGAGESILDVITQAGGTTPEAADEVVIMPQTTSGGIQLQRIAQSVASPGEEAGRQINVANNGDPHAGPPANVLTVPPKGAPTLQDLQQSVTNGPSVVIPLKATAMTGSAHFMNMPVEPGDIVVVPGGGNVMVTGWVYRPGFFQVGSGLTVLGAVGSAGGAMYAANPSDATLMRSDGNGNKVAIPVDLDAIAKGAAPDIPVRANDVIDVPYSTTKIGPYVVYNVLTRMAIPLPTF
ncbi:MAG: polysaccharide biosynthesis/export family protein [Candidatus Binatus sp.]